MKLFFWCFELNKKKKEKGNKNWDFYRPLANNFSKIIRRNYCVKEEYFYCFVLFCDRVTFSQKILYFV